MKTFLWVMAVFFCFEAGWAFLLVVGNHPRKRKPASELEDVISLLICLGFFTWSCVLLGGQ